MKALSIILMLFIASPLLNARIWEDNQGRTVDAEYVKVADDTVTIKRNSDAKEFNIPIETLSNKDQKYIYHKKHDVLFEFYSSYEDEVTFAYLHSLSNSWQFRKMQKDGNRFYITHPVEDEIWYEFVVSPNIWYRKDPFNKNINRNHPYLKRGEKDLITHKNIEVKYVPSEHFDYFTTGDGSKIHELERIYSRLVQKLSIIEDNPQPREGMKIRFYGGMFGGAYTTAGNATITEHGDYPNSHEIIHVLLHRFPHFGPFSEGIAQCFQESGNKLPLQESNCSLAAKNKVMNHNANIWNVLSDFGRHKDYHLAGSFIYYHLFVEQDTKEPFIKFLKELHSGRSLDFNKVRELYKIHLGKDMKYYTDKWEIWIKSIDEHSDIYVDWN